MNVEEVVQNAVAAYDITLTDENDTIVQPIDKITVSIPSDNANCKVFYVQDDTMLDMNAAYVDGAYTFETDRLSVYALIENTSADSETSDTDTSKDSGTSTDIPNTGDLPYRLLLPL